MYIVAPCRYENDSQHRVVMLSVYKSGMNNKAAQTLTCCNHNLSKESIIFTCNTLTAKQLLFDTLDNMTTLTCFTYKANKLVIIFICSTFK